MDHIILALCLLAAVFGLVALARTRKPISPIVVRHDAKLYTYGASIGVDVIPNESARSYRRSVRAARDYRARRVVAGKCVDLPKRANESGPF